MDRRDSGNDYLFLDIYSSVLEGWRLLYPGVPRSAIQPVGSSGRGSYRVHRRGICYRCGHVGFGFDPRDLHRLAHLARHFSIRNGRWLLQHIGWTSCGGNNRLVASLHHVPLRSHYRLSGA